MSAKSRVLTVVAAGALVLLGVGVVLRRVGTDPQPSPASPPPALPRIPPPAPPPPPPTGAVPPPAVLPPAVSPVEAPDDEANPLAAPKDAQELAKVLADLASHDEEVRNTALSRIHNYLVRHPQESAVRLALHHAVSSDPSERIRKHAMALFSLSGHDESFAFALERAVADPSAVVKLHAVERLAKVDDANYWVWLARGSTREQAQARQRDRLEQVRRTFEALGRSPDASVAQAAQAALARLGR